MAIWFIVATGEDHDIAIDLVAVLEDRVLVRGHRPVRLVAAARERRRPADVPDRLLLVFNVYTLSDISPVLRRRLSVRAVSYGLPASTCCLVFPDGTARDQARACGGHQAATSSSRFFSSSAAFFIDPALTDDGCPENPLLVTGSQTPYDIFGALQSLLGVTVLTGLVVALVRRWRAWPRTRRMQFAPVLWAGGVSLSLLSLMIIVDVLGVSDDLRAGSSSPR